MAEPTNNTTETMNEAAKAKKSMHELTREELVNLASQLSNQCHLFEQEGNKMRAHIESANRHIQFLQTQYDLRLIECGLSALTHADKFSPEFTERVIKAIETNLFIEPVEEKGN